MDFNNTPAVDEAEVRRFIEIIHSHAAQLVNGADRTGVLQLCRINPARRRQRRAEPVSRSATSRPWSR